MCDDDACCFEMGEGLGAWAVGGLGAGGWFHGGWSVDCFGKFALSCGQGGCWCWVYDVVAAAAAVEDLATPFTSSLNVMLPKTSQRNGLQSYP